MSLLEQDTTGKGWLNENIKKLDFEFGNSEEYKVEAIRDSIIYVNKLEGDYLPGLYYLIAWKEYPEEEST